ncbi:MAG TPA: NAD(P)-dependent oxidoreductase [Candidatus Atribacteria bacterium]|nr:NAD(P)-dependent oxidoreductase [Candidatus Atribacteria bacterium]
MPILITGGNGLLGSWVTYYLAEKGKDIISFDLKPRSFDYLEEYQDRISFHKGDVLDWSSLVQVFQPQENKIEGIIHTPAVMASPQYWDNPYPSTILNVVGTLNLLELARLYKVPKFLYVSSGAVYGETKDCPGELTHHPNPSDLYGASKAGAEFLTLQYGNHYGIDARVVRPYFFFGPGHLPSEMTPVFRTLLGSIEGLDNLYLEKGKDQRLGFTYVKDTAWGTVLAYEKENPSHRVFNIATDEVTSFPDLAKLAQKYSDEPREVVLGPGKLFPRGETLDISLAKKELGFSPRYRMEEAVAEYAEWIKKVKSTKKS